MKKQNQHIATRQLVQDFLMEKVEKNLSTKIACAALCVRFNDVEGNIWKFKGLRKVSCNSNPHHAWSSDEIMKFFKKIEGKRIDMVVAVHVLWDMAARPQDLLALRFADILSAVDKRYGSVEYK